MAETAELFDNPEYQAFVDKFKPKKTTDDCYTPENIYSGVLEWAAAEYGFSPEAAVRPFWPGGDYERFDYPPDCVVVDNPPFSLTAKICDFYLAHGVRFFIFCPSLTSLGVAGRRNGVALVQAGCAIVYENGAKVRTSFLTDLEDPDIVIRSAPELKRKIDAISKINAKLGKKVVRKLTYPACVLSGANVNQFSQHGVAYAVRRSESGFIRKLDNDANGSGIFGSGLLLSDSATEARHEAERAAAERAAAERAAAVVIELSDREHALQRMMN